MTDNFDLIKSYMIGEGIPFKMENIGDLFFNIMLVRRGKDHPDLPAANYTFKNYYIDSIELYDKFKDEIIKCCELFKLRAYVSVNVKSKEEFSKMCALKYNQNIFNNEYKKPWRVRDHVFGKITAKNNSTWLLDIDDINLNNEEDYAYVQHLISIIERCKSSYAKRVIMLIPTRNGIHILARPFNLKEFNDECNSYGYKDRTIPEVKKNHITLLYENI